MSQESLQLIPVENQDANTDLIFGQLSAGIEKFTTSPATQAEMLPKTSQELRQIFERGLSSILVVRVNKTPLAIAHAALWPLYEQNGIGVFEFGSWFVDPEFRHLRPNGLTVGEMVAKTLLEKSIVNQENTGIIATVKRQNSLRGLKKIGFEPISFALFPNLTSLTCVCTQDIASCPYQRRQNHGETVIAGPTGTIFQFEDIQIPNGIGVNKIPCTLLGYQPDKLQIIDQKIHV